jgi:hypothetical protein
MRGAENPIPFNAAIAAHPLGPIDAAPAMLKPHACAAVWTLQRWLCRQPCLLPARDPHGNRPSPFSLLQQCVRGGLMDPARHRACQGLSTQASRASRLGRARCPAGGPCMQRVSGLAGWRARRPVRAQMPSLNGRGNEKKMARREAHALRLFARERRSPPSPPQGWQCVRSSPPGQRQGCAERQGKGPWPHGARRSSHEALQLAPRGLGQPGGGLDHPTRECSCEGAQGRLRGAGPLGQGAADPPAAGPRGGLAKARAPAAAAAPRGPAGRPGPCVREGRQRRRPVLCWGAGGVARWRVT